MKIKVKTSYFLTLDAFQLCYDLNSKIKTALTIPEIEELLATSNVNMMDNFIAAGIHLNENNLNVYLPEDKALFIWTGTMRAGKGYET